MAGCTWQAKSPALCLQKAPVLPEAPGQLLAWLDLTEPEGPQGQAQQAGASCSSSDRRQPSQEQDFSFLSMFPEPETQRHPPPLAVRVSSAGPTTERGGGHSRGLQGGRLGCRPSPPPARLFPRCLLLRSKKNWLAGSACGERRGHGSGCPLHAERRLARGGTELSDSPVKPKAAGIWRKGERRAKQQTTTLPRWG